MDINKERDALIAEIELFKTEAMKMYFIECWHGTYKTDPFAHSIDALNNIIWMKGQARQLWEFWQAAKAVHKGLVLVPKLSANYLFNQVPQLGFANRDEKDTVLYHLNYMASEFKDSARQFVKLDHEKQQQFIKEEVQEQSHD